VPGCVGCASYEGRLWHVHSSWQCKGQPARLENNWPGFNPNQVLSPKR
jgi:hypothetical protein